MKANFKTLVAAVSLLANDVLIWRKKKKYSGYLHPLHFW